MRSQRGLSLGALLTGGIALGLLLILGAKMVPTFTEYFGLKSVLAVLVQSQAGAPPSEIRASFDKRALIENITSVKADDLDIDQGKEGTTISVNYDKEVPLVANAGIIFHFHIESKSAGKPAGQ